MFGVVRIRIVTSTAFFAALDGHRLLMDACAAEGAWLSSGVRQASRFSVNVTGDKGSSCPGPAGRTGVPAAGRLAVDRSVGNHTFVCANHANGRSDRWRAGHRRLVHDHGLAAGRLPSQARRQPDAGAGVTTP
ncbi:hypothetical protein, partial [Protofrankia coriariae]|uniref:hypothetical protein n=1 Tax=Protofrankia coriariae TaxID=1562887 RepID=UPI001F25D1BC